jgi:hypothetical protein
MRFSGARSCPFSLFLGARTFSATYISQEGSMKPAAAAAAGAAAAAADVLLKTGHALMQPAGRVIVQDACVLSCMWRGHMGTGALTSCAKGNHFKGCRADDRMIGQAQTSCRSELLQYKCVTRWSYWSCCTKSALPLVTFARSAPAAAIATVTTSFLCKLFCCKYWRSSADVVLYARTLGRFAHE